MLITICDKCQNKIGNQSEHVNIEHKGYEPFFIIRKSYHKDCFNTLFSTEIERIKDA